MLKHKNWE